MHIPRALLRHLMMIVVFSIQALSSSPAGELPLQVKRLIEKRQEAIERIDLTFLNELEKIKILYTKAGDLENANMIVNLIEQTKQNDPSSIVAVDGLDTEVSLKAALVGKWMIYDTQNPKTWSGVITITKELNYSCQGSFGLYNNQGAEGRLVIKEGNKSIAIGPYDFLTSRISSGKIFTTNRGPRTLERIK